MYILRWSFSLNLLLTNSARLLASEVQRLPCLPLPSTMLWCFSMLDECWGPNLRSLCLMTDITDWTISPVLHSKGSCPKAVYYLKMSWDVLEKESGTQDFPSPNCRTGIERHQFYDMIQLTVCLNLVSQDNIWKFWLCNCHILRDEELRNKLWI